MKKIIFVTFFASILCACTITTKRRNNPDDVEKVKEFIIDFYRKMELNEDLTKVVPKWEKSNIDEFVTGFRNECKSAENVYFDEIDILYKETDGVVKWEGLVLGRVKCSSGEEEGMEISVEGDSLGLQIRGYNRIIK